MITVKQRKQRDFDSLESTDDIYDVLKSQFAAKKLYIRYAVEQTELSINEFDDETRTFMIVTDPDYEHDNHISVYGLSDKYLEADLEILEERGPGYYKCKIISARRASKGRKDIRFKVGEEEVVATNFRISKHTIDVSGFKMPTSIKVVLDQFKTSNSKMSDFVRVNVLDNEIKDPVLLEIRKTGKSLFISDLSDPESYKALTDDFIDLHSVYGNELPLRMKKNMEKGLKSIIIVPIIYITESESSIPFAYIQLISKTENFGLDKVLELKEHSFKLVDRIRDANTLLISVHQKIEDISRGGAKLRISDENLRKSMLKARGFIFDIVFKLQAPITIYGEIKATYNSDDVLYVGVDFEGNSSRKGEMKRFYSILKPMEAEYKARLIKSIKAKRS